MKVLCSFFAAALLFVQLTHAINDVSEVQITPASANGTGLTSYIIENPLPTAAQTHEMVLVTDTKMLLITQMSDSVLVKAQIDDHGKFQNVAAFQVNKNTSMLHGICNSKAYPGMVWVSLETENRLVLLDPGVDSVNTPPKVVKVIDIPYPGIGPHNVGEYGDELWSGLKEGAAVYRVNHRDPSNYTIFPGVPHPIFIAQHPVNNLFYASEDDSSKILQMDPIANTSKQIDVPPSAGQTPVGLITGPQGIWFTLLGNKTAGTGTVGRINADESFTFFKLNGTLGRDAALLHLAFLEPENDHTLYLLTSSITFNDALDMVIVVKFDDNWSKIVSEQYLPLPTQQCWAHRLLLTASNIMVTELTKSKLFSWYTETVPASAKWIAK
ncbi:hypothetical protein BC940DRAFT_262010 [Gongronella butleri]|nr:hypothetical protein BC940DRAFT_262010 [Gongronella butleri]